MGSRLREAIARNLRKPEATIIGRLVKKIALEKMNCFLELEAVRLCDIQPDHQVLEVGFGPGIGIQATYHIVKDGNGEVYGIDFSEEMVLSATRLLRKGIGEGKVSLINAEAADLSCFQSNTFDRVFHCNCYYFWPDMTKATNELHRVMKPGATMVTTMNPERLKISQSRGFFKYGNPDQRPYIKALQSSGFCGVQLKTLKHESSGASFDAIFAKKPGF
ncbi:uncharacterized protein LOC110456850 [Mizuhopecten yessoensis]|uniref:Methyltransferase YdaC n=1 Tax=Mizuhopecten yessoensis TaxID=6573 RepID=A0A210QA00_MIZYE|nr:uncharacterized protein LOC110456850 [Mizuhopecten yessoensis]XP_021363527.1 uncharacterized protein LOC110456850 [Mizuhopecten yessoensis]XP_021363528.1 uncharacterized protein LOC110456850 [Mizuhopecten yessoensis]XP_021363529.1 uncharacterized protein LOC110456850 [Mizuhopecten yessoensis]XP_021363530.1 uncharacterized protein LOC110456850 [Mizuhopecten yessoensis]XP_021363531.1 uncharacterized protein LOC110456850 [Mizuhopecten yessoensis]XP_021363532.1 uncharacterized protein LOC11045